MNRHCSHIGCGSQPTSTLVYDYARSTATMGPLTAEADPSGYDLCLNHARHLHVPSGWHLEHVGVLEPPSSTSAGWLDSLADEVRSIGWREEPATSREAVGVAEIGRRGYLHIITDATDRP